MGEQELALVGVETDKPQLVADQQIEPIERGLEARQTVLGLGLGELGHESGDGHETDPLALPAGRQPERGRDDASMSVKPPAVSAREDGRAGARRTA